MCATAENVVPMSIPTALGWVMSEKSENYWSAQPRGCSGNSAVSVPETRRPAGNTKVDNRCILQPPSCGTRARRPQGDGYKSSEALRDDFFRTNQLAAPGKTAPDAHYDLTVFLRITRRLETDHPVHGAVDAVFRLDFFDLEAMKNFH